MRIRFLVLFLFASNPHAILAFMCYQGVIAMATQIPVSIDSLTDLLSKDWVFLWGLPVVFIGLSIVLEIGLILLLPFIPAIVILALAWMWISLFRFRPSDLPMGSYAIPISLLAGLTVVFVILATNPNDLWNPALFAGRVAFSIFSSILSGYYMCRMISRRPVAKTIPDAGAVNPS